MDTTTTEFTGIEDGKIIVDSYSGEAMNPDYAWIWRDYTSGRANVSAAEERLREMGIEWGTITIDMVDDDAPFIWRDLTPEEQAWCEQQYTERNPWSNRP